MKENWGKKKKNHDGKDNIENWMVGKRGGKKSKKMKEKRQRNNEVKKQEKRKKRERERENWRKKKICEMRIFELSKKGWKTNGGNSRSS